LTGLRPTGRFHLGNYVGTFEKDLELQKSGEYECFFLIADYHTLTTGFETSNQIGEDIREGVLDFLAVGIDPSQSTLYLQSLIPEVSELFLLFTMLVSATRAQRIPTLKEQIRDLKLESASLGLLNYPVLQAADILMVRGEVVPVGKDQMSHIELTREVARRFNTAFRPVFPEPDAKLTEIPKVPGTDGRKMSKSYGNDIELADSPEVIRQKVRPMMTDPARKRRTDPGNPEICPIFDLHKIFTPPDDREYAATGCRTAGIGCLDCKEVLLKHMIPPLSKIRERRQAFAEKPDTIREILFEGSRRARKVAEQTMTEVRAAVHLQPL